VLRASGALEQSQPDAATKAFELMLTVFFNNLETRLADAGP